MGFAHKTPPQALPSTQNPKESFNSLGEMMLGLGIRLGCNEQVERGVMRFYIQLTLNSC